MSSKKHFWVPPPALTSPAKVVAAGTKRSRSPAKRRVRSGLRADKSKPASAARPDVTSSTNFKQHAESSNHDFVAQLEELLDEIRQVKSNEKTSARHAPYVGGRGDGDMHDVAAAKSSTSSTSKLLNQHDQGVKGLSDKERHLIRKSLGLVKDELLKNLTSSGRSHSLLVEKLKRIEQDAGDAVRHVASLRHFIQQLNQDEIMKSGDSAMRLEKSKQLLVKLSRLDDANRSLQNLIGGIVAVDEPQPAITEPFNLKSDHVERQNFEIKNLKDQLEAERQEILNLKAALNEVTLSSNAEKQSLKTEIRAHRERANKYLSDFDAVRIELNDKNEILSNSKMELENQRLCATRFSSDNSKLRFENATLKSQLRSDDSSVRTKMNEMESSFHKMSSKATILELENSKLKLTLASTHAVVSRQKSEIERLEKKLEKCIKSTGHFTTDNQAKKNKTVPVDLLPDKSPGDRATRETDEVKWIKVTELYQIIEKEKAFILKQLKDLEIKLELCEVSNQAFRKELTDKEEIMLQNNLKLQDRISESNALKEALEVALNDVRKFSDETKRPQTSDQTAREKFEELEATVLRYRVENEQIRKQKDQTERKLTAEIDELRGLLESVRSSNRTLQEYVKFLRNSYADVFGERFLRTTTEL